MLRTVAVDGDLQGFVRYRGQIQEAQFEHALLSLAQQIRQLVLLDITRGEEMIADQHNADTRGVQGRQDVRVKLVASVNVLGIVPQTFPDARDGLECREHGLQARGILAAVTDEDLVAGHACLRTGPRRIDCVRCIRPVCPIV